MPHETPRQPDPLEAAGPASTQDTRADHASPPATGCLNALAPDFARNHIRAVLAEVQDLFRAQQGLNLSLWEQGASWERVIAKLLEAKSAAMRARNGLAEQMEEERLDRLSPPQPINLAGFAGDFFGIAQHPEIRRPA
jgi:hypothetical protein